MIIRGGENIYPAEVEQFLFTHPKVLEVQVRLGTTGGQQRSETVSKQSAVKMMRSCSPVHLPGGRSEGWAAGRAGVCLHQAEGGSDLQSRGDTSLLQRPGEPRCWIRFLKENSWTVCGAETCFFLFFFKLSLTDFSLQDPTLRVLRRQLPSNSLRKGTTREHTPGLSRWIVLCVIMRLKRLLLCVSVDQEDDTEGECGEEIRSLTLWWTLTEPAAASMRYCKMTDQLLFLKKFLVNLYLTWHDIWKHIAAIPGKAKQMSIKLWS